jgi:hypothetical protein
MLKLLRINVNPKNRKTGDCSTRALCSLLGCKWQEALKLQCEESCRSCYDMTSHQVMEAILNKAGWVKRNQPRKDDGLKYKVCEMDKVLSPESLRKGVIVDVAHHYVYLKDNQYWDTWDSGLKTVGNYYECEKETHVFDNLPKREAVKIRL